jgi:flavin-dependent dehydrogenase
MTGFDISKIDVTIIGAGIAGLHLSKKLEEKGINHVIFEKNDHIGKYGNRIINRDVFNILDLTKEEIIRPIKEMNFFSPSEIQLYKKSEHKRGYITNIELIEKYLFNNLNNKNSIQLNNFVTNVNFEKGTIKTNKNKNIVKSKSIIIASGIHQKRFISKLNIKEPQKVFCFTNEIVGDDIITTILDNNLAHGFYGWIIPLKENVIEVGFGSDRVNEIQKSNLEEKLFTLPYIKNFKKNRKLLNTGGGFIPTSMIDFFCGKNWALIGDASGGEPLMGGSIHKAIDEAEMAAKTIEMYLNGEINSLETFNGLWNKEMMHDIKKQENVRSILNNATNEEINDCFKRLQNQKIEGDGLINSLFMNIIKNLVHRGD